MHIFLMFIQGYGNRYNLINCEQEKKWLIFAVKNVPDQTTATNLPHQIEFKHCGFLEHWNRQKSLTLIRPRFSCLLDEGIAKICKRKKNPLWDAHGHGRINLKIFLGDNVNYLSIWSFMHHLWFPTRTNSNYWTQCRG